MNSPSLLPTQTRRNWALPLLLAGAIGLSFGPIFVRISEVGPVGTAFYRLILALPLLWAWTVYEDGVAARKGKDASQALRNRGGWKWLFLSGLCFAADLALWHWSIIFTTVANATLLTNVAPVFVTIGAWLFLKERVTARFLAGMVSALAGAAILIGVSVGIGKREFLGDILGLSSAVFYAGYILSIKQARATLSTSVTMLWSGIITSAVLLLLTLVSEDRILPVTLYGWGILAGLAFCSQGAGQTLVAYSLAHLPASFASVALLLQPVAAAGLAWLILNETLSVIQGIGGLLVLTGIFIAWRSSAIIGTLPETGMVRGKGSGRSRG